MAKTSTRTIEDFGEQWQHYSDTSGFWASKELLRDITMPLLDPDKIAGTRVAEVGSGSGRVVNMLMGFQPARLVALEPSQAGFESLKVNTAQHGDKIEYLQALGDQLPAGLDLDFAFSIGVIQFIPEPDSTIRAMLNALKPGGRCLIWLYSVEGNEAYLRFALPLRAITTRLPHFLLAGVCGLLNLMLSLYIGLCHVLPLPMRTYMNGHLGKMSFGKRYLTIYDQLNPTYAKYYTRAEALDLLQRNGFSDVQVHHRHGYSWTILGTRPAV